MARILVTVPAYNEAVVIERTLHEIQTKIRELLPEHDVAIEVVDNASTDDTAEIVRRHQGVALRSLVEKGKGLAIRTSWMAHAQDTDVLLFTDADLAADLSALPALIDPILRGEADVVCGSRFVAGAGVERRWAREIASRFFRVLQHRLLGLPVEDAQCGLKAISAEVGQKLLPRCQESGWLFDSELLAYAVREKMRIREIPVHWVEHRDPKRRSALRLSRDGWAFLLGLAKIRQRVFG